MVTVTSPDGKFRTRYLHLSAINVEDGQEITEATQVGEIPFPQSLLQGTLGHWFMFFGEYFALLFRINPRPQSPLRAFGRL